MGDHAVWAIIGFGVFQQMSAGLYDISYLVNFSKINNDTHTGRELGIMQIIEKVAKVASRELLRWRALLTRLTPVIRRAQRTLGVGRLIAGFTPVIRRGGWAFPFTNMLY